MKRMNERGAVSMISVLILSIIITIVVTAYVRAIVSQQRDAINYDLSTRAYYAAESGVQDAIRGSSPTYPAKTDCNPTLGGGSYNTLVGNDQLAYTCQLVDPTPGEVVGSVGQQESAFIKLNPTETLGAGQEWRVQLRWSQDENLQPRSDGSKLFPPKASWGDTHPVLRTAVISHNNSNFGRSGIFQNVYFINPTDSSNQGADSAPPVVGRTSAQSPDTVVTNGVCSAAGNSDNSSYKCWRTLRLGNEYNFSTQSIYVHLKALYRDNVKFQVVLQRCNSSGEANCVTVRQDNVQATVDVTARAGNVFRRVKQAVQLDKENFKPIVGLDAALVAGDGICKSFKVGTTPQQYIPGCNPTN